MVFWKNAFYPNARHWKIALGYQNATRGPFFEAGLDLELDFDFQADVGMELDGLALPGEVKLDLLYRKSSSAHFLYMENALQKEMLMGNSVWARFGTRFYSKKSNKIEL